MRKNRLKYKGLIMGILLLICPCILNATAPFLNNRENVNLVNWKFHKGDSYGANALKYNDSNWQSVSVPHTYSKDAVDSIGYYRGLAWYRTILKNKFDDNKRIFIRFEGVGQEAVVYLNGKHVGSHAGSYSAFTIELTKGWNRNGSNELAVKVDNSLNWSVIPVSLNLFNIYGGIYRPVTLFTTPKACISPLFYASSGVFVESKPLNSKEAEVKTNVHLSGLNAAGEKELKLVIKNEKGKTVSQDLMKLSGNEDEKVVTFNNKIEKYKLWNAKENPYLYSMYVVLSDNGVSDSVKVDFGIRDFKVDADKGFVLNGKAYRLYGVARHQEWRQYANALTDANHIADFNLIKEIGATAIRLAHYQQADIMYKMADENGVVVWAEIPFVHSWSGKEDANAKQQMSELVYQNFNHPSICFWGVFNEVRAYRNADAPCVKLAKDLNALVHKIDPTRLTTSATDQPMGEPMNGITDLQAWNKYYGWYDRYPYKMMGTFLDNTHKDYPNIKIAISEYGAGGNVFQQDRSKAQYPSGLYFPEQLLTDYHEANWEEIKSRGFVWSSFVWNLCDFGVNRWARGGIDHINHKGLVTYDRSIKKDAFFFYKANWNKAPMVYITERRNVIRKTNVIDIKAYCNIDNNAELYVNGVLIGKCQPDDIKRVIWKNVKLNAGDNKVVVKCKQGKNMYEDTTNFVYKK